MDTSKIKIKLTESTVAKKSTFYYHKHKRLLPLISFTAGFTWDSLTLTRIDRLSDNLILFFYLLLLGSVIILLHLIKNNLIERPGILKYQHWLMPAEQFFFGGLFSAYVVFYFQSASLSKNWLFMLFLIGLLIGNEFLKEKLSDLRLNLSLYFLAVFSFFIFFIPILFHTMNIYTFLLSGIISLIFISALLYYLFKKETHPRHTWYKHTALLLLSIFAGLNSLYFMNWIPPVPLSLKEGGIYHHIHKNVDQYEMRFEKGSWYQFWKNSDDIFHYAPGDTVFCFASVFAPTKLDKSIIHHWQIYNKRQGRWLTTDRRSYRIVGGRDGGYRGYSYKKNMLPGEWRVDVETKEKSLLGRIRFKIRKFKTDSANQIHLQTILR